MLNQCQFIGNLGRDPEVRTTQSGSKIVNLSIAVSERWSDKQTGEKKERTEWVPVVIFSEPLGRIAERYLRKGSKVFIQGQFTTRKWQDQSGADRYSTEVVLRPFRGELTLLDAPQRDNSREGYSNASQGGSPAGLDESEIPF